MSIVSIYEKNPALVRHFQPVFIFQPTETDTISMTLFSSFKVADFAKKKVTYPPASVNFQQVAIVSNFPAKCFFLNLVWIVAS